MSSLLLLETITFSLKVALKYVEAREFQNLKQIFRKVSIFHKHRATLINPSHAPRLISGESISSFPRGRSATPFQSCKIDSNNKLFSINVPVQFFSKIVDYCMRLKEKSVKFSVTNAQDSFDKALICLRKFGNIEM